MLVALFALLWRWPPFVRLAIAQPRRIGRSFAAPIRWAFRPTATCPTTGPPRENVAWKTDIPGRGWSSPIVWGDKIFLTTVVNLGEERGAEEGTVLRRRASQAARRPSTSGRWSAST